MKTPKEIAAQIVSELREHPERWTQGHWARDAEGNKVNWRDQSAVCWCLEGHIYRLGGDAGEFALAAGTSDGTFTGLASFNDRYDLDSVIELCEKVAQL